MPCPRCGSMWVKRSGFVVCSKCGHCPGTQHLDRLLSDYGQVIRRRQALMLGQSSVDPVDDEDQNVGFPKGRRNQPLKFDL